MPQIYTPENLRPKEDATATNLEHLAMPMVHPTMGETISSYKKLMNDPATMEIWQTAFGKYFGGMAQGDNKMGQKGTNTIFVMTHAEILLIPADRTITYARVVVNFRPQIMDPQHTDHGGWQNNQLPQQTHDKNSRPHHIKTNVEQCPQHRRHEVHVPRHQEFLLDCPPRSFRIHEDAAFSIPILDEGTIQFGQVSKKRICISQNATRRMRPSPSKDITSVNIHQACGNILPALSLSRW